MGAKRKIRPGKTEGHSQRRSGALVEVAENVQEGAGVVGEKISIIAEKTADATGNVLDVLKDRISHAYQVGAKAVDDVTRVAQEYAQKHKQNSEIKRLRGQQEQLMAQLGYVAYRKFKDKKWSLELLSQEEEAIKMYEEIERLDREVVKVGRQLESVD